MKPSQALINRFPTAVTTLKRAPIAPLERFKRDAAVTAPTEDHPAFMVDRWRLALDLFRDGLKPVAIYVHAPRLMRNAIAMHAFNELVTPPNPRQRDASSSVPVMLTQTLSRYITDCRVQVRKSVFSVLFAAPQPPSLYDTITGVASEAFRPRHRAQLRERSDASPPSPYPEPHRIITVVLDGVRAPTNLGAAVRSVAALGCHGVVVTPMRRLVAADTAADVEQPMSQVERHALKVAASGAATTSADNPVSPLGSDAQPVGWSAEALTEDLELAIESAAPAGHVGLRQGRDGSAAASGRKRRDDDDVDDPDSDEATWMDSQFGIAHDVSALLRERGLRLVEGTDAVSPWHVHAVSSSVGAVASLPISRGTAADVIAAVDAAAVAASWARNAAAAAAADPAAAFHLAKLAEPIQRLPGWKDAADGGRVWVLIATDHGDDCVPLPLLRLPPKVPVVLVLGSEAYGVDRAFVDRAVGWSGYQHAYDAAMRDLAKDSPAGENAGFDSDIVQSSRPSTPVYVKVKVPMYHRGVPADTVGGTLMLNVHVAGSIIIQHLRSMDVARQYGNVPTDAV